LVHGIDVLRQPGGDDRPRHGRTFAVIAPASAPLFILGQLVAVRTFDWLFKQEISA